MNSTHPIPTATGNGTVEPSSERAVVHDWEGDVPLSTTILSLVGSATDADPTELEPLNDAVDPDALDALFAPREGGTPRRPGTVSFRFAGFTVTVDADGTVALRPANRPDDA